MWSRTIILSVEIQLLMNFYIQEAAFGVKSALFSEPG